MTPMKTKDFVRLIESHGFRLARVGKHLVYRRGPDSLAIAHSKMASVGVVRSFFRMIQPTNQNTQPMAQAA